MPVPAKGAQRASSVTQLLVIHDGPGPWSATSPIRRIVLGTALAAILLSTVAAPTFAAGPLAWDPPESGVGSGLRPGDRVSDHGITVIAPRAGGSVYAALEFDDGTAQEVLVETDLGGSVEVSFWGDESLAVGDHEHSLAGSELEADHPDATGSGRSWSECRQDSNALFGWKIPVYRWWYASTTTPRKFKQRPHGQREVIRAIIRANRHVVSANNRCGRRDTIAARFEFLGKTRRLPSPTSTANCGRGDQRSVIGWGRLPRTAIAYVCVHGDALRGSREADIQISSRAPYETRMSRCHGEFLIEDPMTHEFGHVYGLAHVRSESLTMHPGASWCSKALTTLGSGDLRGLERRY